LSIAVADLATVAATAVDVTAKECLARVTERLTRPAERRALCDLRRERVAHGRLSRELAERGDASHALRARVD
jgi:hypothetical protein